MTATMGWESGLFESSVDHVADMGSDWTLSLADGAVPNVMVALAGSPERTSGGAP